MQYETYSLQENLIVKLLHQTYNSENNSDSDTGCSKSKVLKLFGSIAQKFVETKLFHYVHDKTLP